jgi:phospholipid transport system substrate-binding protein
MKRRLWIISLALAALYSSLAQAQTQTPTAYVRGILDQVLAIQNKPGLAAQETARAREIRQVIQRSFDFPLMAQNSLGPAYGRLGAGQRREFTDTFSYLFQDSYTRLVLKFLKQETIKYQQERLEDGKARVSTAIARSNETIPVDYLLHRTSQGWLLYDVVVDGVSILENYRSQFSQVIRTHSFDYLLNQMKTQRRATP